MEYLLLDALIEVVADCTHEHALREAGNLAGRNERVHLCVDGGGNVLTVDEDGLPFLQHLAELTEQREPSSFNLFLSSERTTKLVSLGLSKN